MKDSLLKGFINYQINTLGLLVNKKITISKILNKPWALVDGDFEIQKLIFEKDGKLILSKNGIVQEGRWEYYPEANSFIIDRRINKILCNLLFVDDAVVILKLDGTKNEFFAFANEKVIPSLNILEYLNSLIIETHVIKQFNLNNGRKLNVYFDNENSAYEGYYKDVPVTFDNNEHVKDGFHFSSNYEFLFIIQDGKIKSKSSCINYTLNNNQEIFVYADKYIFKLDGISATGDLCLKDNVTHLICDNGILAKRYYQKYYIINKQKTLTIWQTDENSISINDEVLNCKGFTENDFNFRQGLTKYFVSNNRIVKVSDKLAAYIFLFVILILIAAFIIIIFKTFIEI